MREGQRWRGSRKQPAPPTWSPSVPAEDSSLDLGCPQSKALVCVSDLQALATHHTPTQLAGHTRLASISHPALGCLQALAHPVSVPHLPELSLPRWPLLRWLPQPSTPQGQVFFPSSMGFQSLTGGGTAQAKVWRWDMNCRLPSRILHRAQQRLAAASRGTPQGYRCLQVHRVPG